MTKFRTLIENSLKVKENLHPVDELFQNSHSTDSGKLALIHKLPNLSTSHIKIATDHDSGAFLNNIPEHENVRRAILANPRLEAKIGNVNKFYRPELGDKPHMVANKELRDILSHREAMQGRDTSHSKNYTLSTDDQSRIEYTRKLNDDKHEKYMDGYRNKMVDHKNPNEKVFDTHV